MEDIVRLYDLQTDTTTDEEMPFKQEFVRDYCDSVVEWTTMDGRIK